MSKTQSEPPDGYLVRVAIDTWTMDTPSVEYPYIPYLRIWYATRAEAIAACWAHKKAHTPPRVLGSQESGAKDLNMNGGGMTFGFNDTPREPPWGDYDFSKPSLVVAASNGSEGVVLWGVGGHIRFEMEEAGFSHIDDLGLKPPSAGILVWEGKYVWGPGSWENPQDTSSEPEGTWRIPTETEWVAILAGKCPWDDNDWKLKA